MKPLNIFVVGAGKIGRTLIEALAKEGNNVTLVDIDENKIKEMSDQFDIMTCVGNGASYRVLVDTGIQEADIFIAVTQSDELNLLCCSVASQVSTCNTIARVRTPDYSAEVWYLRDKLGLTMVINPELESASEISHILNYPAALDVSAFAGGEAEMIRFKIREDSPVVGKLLPEFIKNLKVRMLFTAVDREGEAFIPNGLYRFAEGDTIAFVTTRKDAIECLKELGLYKNPIKKCFIVGGSKGAYYLAEHLLRAGLEVKIVERNRNRCEELSVLLPKATIINGDGTSTELLREEEIQYYDAIISYTDIDEVNVMLSLYAEKFCEAKVITKIGRRRFNKLYEELDIGSIVLPRRITTDLILGYTRAKRVAGNGNIETLYHMFDDRVEAIEFKISSQSVVTDVPLMNLDLNDNVVIAFIYRKGKLIFPKGDDVIKVGDSVMIVTTNFGYNDVLDILK